MTEETNNVHKAIGDIEKCLEGKHTVEINALKNAFKIFELEKKITEQDLENKNLKLENENKSLKLKCDTVEVTPTCGKQLQPPVYDAPKPQEDIFMNTDDLLSKGIAKFFFGEKIQTVFYNLYQEWFNVMTKRLTKNSSFIYERFVLVKLKWNDSIKGYSFYSHKEKTSYENNSAFLKIFDKEWKHETSSVLILHPSVVNCSIQMGENFKCSTYHRWNVESISKEHIDKDGSFIVLCLKK